MSRFDEALVSLDAITHCPFKLRRHGETALVESEQWIEGDFSAAMLERSALEPLAIQFEDIDDRSSIPSLLGFASAEIRPRLLERSQQGQEMISRYQGFDCLFRRADGSQISHGLLSFGQKRLFSFLWYLAVREKLPVVADELLNGLHHEWIEICFDRLRERQSFLATQHPLLLDHIPVESAEAARTTFVRCSLEAGPDGRERMVWRNFNEEEAERFFVAYKTGIQHVSEVLRTEGLW